MKPPLWWNANTGQYSREAPDSNTPIRIIYVGETSSVIAWKPVEAKIVWANRVTGTESPQIPSESIRVRGWSGGTDGFKLVYEVTGEASHAKCLPDERSHDGMGCADPDCTDPHTR